MQQVALGDAGRVTAPRSCSVPSRACPTPRPSAATRPCTGRRPSGKKRPWKRYWRPAPTPTPATTTASRLYMKPRAPATRPASPCLTKGGADAACASPTAPTPGNYQDLAKGDMPRARRVDARAQQVKTITPPPSPKRSVDNVEDQGAARCRASLVSRGPAKGQDAAPLN